MDLDEPAKNLNSLHFQPPLSPSQNSIPHFHFLPHATSDLQLQNVSARIFHDSSLAMAIRSRSSPRVLALLPVDFIMLMHSLNSKELMLCNSLSSKFHQSLFFFTPLGRTNRPTIRLPKKSVEQNTGNPVFSDKIICICSFWGRPRESIGSRGFLRPSLSWGKERRASGRLESRCPGP